MEPGQVAEAAARSHGCDRQAGVAQEMPGELDPDAQEILERADAEGVGEAGQRPVRDCE